MTSMNSTLAATLMATIAGISAWFLGFAAVIWPAHPQFAVLLVTILAIIVVKRSWPARSALWRD